MATLDIYASIVLEIHMAVLSDLRVKYSAILPKVKPKLRYAWQCSVISV
jgi:hypothetical protein